MKINSLVIKNNKSINIINRKLFMIFIGFICYLGIDLINVNVFLSSILMRGICSGILAMGLDVFTGLAGQLSMGSAAFMGIGAYASSILTVEKNESTIFIIMGLFSTIVFCLIISFLLGYPLLKLKGDYLAFATLGFGEITRISFENLKITNGAKGLFGIPHYTNLKGCFIFFIIILVMLKLFKMSKIGLFLKAVSDDEMAAKACGVNTAKAKTIAFCVCCITCGIGGFLYSGIVGFISPKDFNFSKSIDILAAVILGGKGTLIGPFLTAMALELLSVLLQGFSIYKMIIFSLLLIIVTLIKYAKPYIHWNKMGAKKSKL